MPRARRYAASRTLHLLTPRTASTPTGTPRPSSATEGLAAQALSLLSVPAFARVEGERVVDTYLMSELKRREEYAEGQLLRARQEQRRLADLEAQRSALSRSAFCVLSAYVRVL